MHCVTVYSTTPSEFLANRFRISRKGWDRGSPN